MPSNKNLYVNPVNGNNTSSGKSDNPLKTISQALALATDGTTINLEQGIYNSASGEKFPLVIPSGVIVVGDETSKGKGILIEGSGEYVSPTFGQQNIAIALDSKAQLRGVTVTNRASKGTGVWIESRSPIVANNTFTVCTMTGIFITGTAKPIIVDNVLIQNGSSGIYLARNAKGEVRRNIAQKTGYGITVSDRAAPLIADNKIFANRVGIVLSRESRPVFRNNLIEQNTQLGLLVNDTAIPDLGNSQDPAGNIFRDNTTFDLQNNTANTLISSGNQLNPARIQGKMQFLAAMVSGRPLGPGQLIDIYNHWAETFIQALVNRGLINGFPDGTFKPEASMTRAEYAALIAKAFNQEAKQQTKAGFKDVPENFWAAAAISKASAMGFISGFGDRTFRPGQNLTRVQAIASIVSGLGLTGGNPNLLSQIADRAQIPSYATNAVAIAIQKRLLVNYPLANQLQPMRDITRAEVASLIYQALLSTGQVTLINSSYILNTDRSLPTFTDIGSHWAADFIRELAIVDLINGFADGTFKPDSQINRAQYAALLVKAFNPIAKRPPTQFTDVSPDFWAFLSIQQANSGGFLSGFPDKTFRPSQNLIRLQLVVSLVNGLSLPAGDEKVLNQYSDSSTIPASARSVVATAIQRGLLVYPGEDNLSLLNLNREATRAEAAAIVYQGLVNIGRMPSIKSPYIISAVSGMPR